MPGRVAYAVPMVQSLPTPAAPARIGTRGSPLALAQAMEARTRLCGAFDLPEEAFGITVIRTAGDRVRHRALRDIGGKGLFTREIEEALLGGHIDIAVHSVKDMPVQQPGGLVLDCFLPRGDVRDALVSGRHRRIGDLPEGARVGTSSPRRRAQLLSRRRDLDVVEFRGNVRTRLGKLERGLACCTLLAMAGLDRLGMDGIPATPMEPDETLPALAQGAIGIERRAGDMRMAGLLEAVHHGPTGDRLAAERAFLKGLDGSCGVPVAGLAELCGTTLRLRGELLLPDGSDAVSDDRTAPVGDGAALGETMARAMLRRAGAGWTGRLSAAGSP